jgi:hypothetical protein
MHGVAVEPAHGNGNQRDKYHHSTQYAEPEIF